MSLKATLAVIAVLVLGYFAFVFVNTVIFPEPCCGQGEEEEIRTRIVSINGIDIPVEVRDTHAGRTKGLSDHEHLEEGTGMLFIFPESGHHSFWMKDMNFSIDIAWIDEQQQIVFIEENVSPETYPDSFAPDTEARYVLEVNAGFFDRQGIAVGDTVIFEE